MNEPHLIKVITCMGVNRGLWRKTLLSIFVVYLLHGPSSIESKHFLSLSSNFSKSDFLTCHSLPHQLPLTTPHHNSPILQGRWKLFWFIGLLEEFERLKGSSVVWGGVEEGWGPELGDLYLLVHLRGRRLARSPKPEEGPVMGAVRTIRPCLYSEQGPERTSDRMMSGSLNTKSSSA